MGVLRGMPRNVSTDIHRGTVGEGPDLWGVLRGMPRNVSTDIHRGTVGEDADLWVC